MVENCRAANVRLLVHENCRWQPWDREVRKLIEADVFGRLFHLGFCPRNGDGRGERPYTIQLYFREMPRLLIYERMTPQGDLFVTEYGEPEMKH